MKTIVAALFLAFACTLVHAEEAAVPVSTDTAVADDGSGVPLEKIVTRDGVVYNGCKLVKVEPDGILIEYTPRTGAFGLAKVKFSSLPLELQKQFNYDPSEAAEFEGLQQKANTAWARQVREKSESDLKVAQELQKQSSALRLAEERARLDDERLAAQRAHEEKLAREEAYAAREVARWQSPQIVWPVVQHHHHGKSRNPTVSGRR